jgi:ATP-dependent helicase HrpA
MRNEAVQNSTVASAGQATPAARGIDRLQYAAIHRALLSGLLGNVGLKNATYEYTGTRGRKFHLFPGSGQFSRRPLWVMAGELAETTKLYARTVARVEPEWIERVGEHLLTRTYSEPYYHRKSTNVVASEKVSLFGLVLVPRRQVHYGPIEPKISREIFIRQALVEGEYQTNAPWERHNRQLLREVELTAAKLRRRDILTDAESRFAFFDARVPAGVYNGPLFEKWRRSAEGRDRRVLFMRREDLLIPGPDAPAAQFPDHVVVNESVRLALHYVFDPSDPADGVSAVIPLALLNQLPAEPFEWLVPGYLLEKVTELIRTLPKDLRVQFVPVPETARNVAGLLRFGEGSLHEQLAWELGKMIGQTVPAASFNAEYLPNWLRMNFRVIDEAGRALESGRDLEAIRRKLRVELKSVLQTLPTSEWHRDNITRWDFPDLPETVELKRPGMTVRAFPAIVEQGNGVSLRLLDTVAAAAEATRVGLRRLFLLQIGEQVKYLQRNLPGIDQMCLQYKTLGSCDELRRDIIAVAADRALFGDDPGLIRRRDDFISRAEQAWHRISTSAEEISAIVGEVLDLRQSLLRKLDQPMVPVVAANAADIREQLTELLPGGFVAKTPYAWLRQIPRFLKGAELRLKKLLNAGVSRDTQMMEQVRPLWKKYVARRELHRHQQLEDPALAQYRWALEELRVSLFAQELRTSMPISVKRVEQLFAEVR